MIYTLIIKLDLSMMLKGSKYCLCHGLYWHICSNLPPKKSDFKYYNWGSFDEWFILENKQKDLLMNDFFASQGGDHGLYSDYINSWH